MKSPFFKTALMGIMAAVAAAVATAYYPWPEKIVESDLVGKPLFPSYDASSVRSISITKYDSDRNGLDRIELRRSGEKWIIPARQNFVATNATQISLAVNSLTGTVLETRSSDQQDHVDYGVVDPFEYESVTNRSSLGTKIVLEDRNNRELASLIVGSSPRGEGGGQLQKHFVRIPGQPNVYVLEIPSDALATGFTRWVSSNLLNLGNETAVQSISINNYRLSPEQLSSAAGKRTWNYEVFIDAKNSIRSLNIPDASGENLKESELTDENIVTLRSLGSFIGNIVFTDVQKKSAATAQQLKKQVPDKPIEPNTLQEFGFTVADTNSKSAFGLQFEAVGGEVIVRTVDGVAVSILIGSMVENQTGNSAGDLTLNYNLMLYATVDESIFPLPEKPDIENADADTAENEQKAYLRLVAARNDKIKLAIQRASELNQSYGDWYYIVSEPIINGIRPDLAVGSETK